jgi:hypothetical protein
MAAPDSVKPAKKHMVMNAREGFPRKSCFSLEWMIYESHHQAERLNFSIEGRAQLAAQYKNMVDEEILRRQSVKELVCEEVLFGGKSFKFFELQCHHCRYYCYLSCLACKHCQLVTCLACKPACQCGAASRVLFVRHTEHELINC